MTQGTLKRVGCAATIAAAFAIPAATAEAASYKGKASGETLTFSQSGTRISNIKTLIYVTCFSSESGTDGGFELYRPPGKYKFGSSTHRIKSQDSAVRGGRKSFSYTVTPNRKSRRKITGKLRLTYVDSVYDPFSNSIVFWNCSGVTGFTATKR
jgi:hypothetical protein